MNRFSVALVLLALSLLVSSCASTERVTFDQKEADAAVLPDIAGVRFLADAPAGDLSVMLRAISAGTAAREEKGITHLALSGGGGDGAYGAGILNGWTESGSRPEFTIVSGVSTGALIAPFAFLGPSYDATLKELYTGGLADTLFGAPNVANAIFGSGLFGTHLIREMVARYIDQPMLDDIARAHARGRRLLVVTTNLDTQRAVVWDMGTIARSGAPSSLPLFRDVLVASASIPVVFPPTLIDVTANGRQFQEMHVDGAVTAPVFTLPDAYLLGIAQISKLWRSKIYIIMNNKIEPSIAVIANGTIAVATRASATFVKQQTRSVIFGTYQATRRSHVEFNITYIERYWPDPPGAGFDTAYMTLLFNHGYEKGRSGSFWENTPPYLSASTGAAGGADTAMNHRSAPIIAGVNRR
jgi:predicted patatin/cPLA2 family phospholipase